MKIYIKLTKQETNQWSGIKSAVIGDGQMSDGEFAKVMLFRGLNGFMNDLNKAMDEMSEDDKQKIIEEHNKETFDNLFDGVEVEVPTQVEEATTPSKNFDAGVDTPKTPAKASDENSNSSDK